MAFWLIHVAAVGAIGILVFVAGHYGCGVKMEYLIAFAGALLIAQFIDIDHSGDPVGKANCAISLDVNKCTKYHRGIFHNPELYHYSKAILAGLLIGWNIHLRLDGIL